MLPDTHLSTLVLFIDDNAADRKFFAEGLKQCSPDYRMYEASAIGTKLTKTSKADRS